MAGNESDECEEGGEEGRQEEEGGIFAVPECPDTYQLESRRAASGIPTFIIAERFDAPFDWYTSI